ncbi:hypothetical protein ACHWQZ_G017973 [Mnemiopsis leidyi]
MDVDDHERELVEALFQCTTDEKSVLVMQFLQVLGNRRNININQAEFYLQMTGWNVDEAIESYLRVDGGPDLSMCFVKEMPLREGESIPPATPYTKIWRIRNDGTEAWLPGCTLRCSEGQESDPSLSTQILLEPIDPGVEIDIRLDIVSPHHPGVYQSKWRACSPDGIYFGEPIWMVIMHTSNLNQLITISSLLAMMPQKRRKIGRPNKEELQYETYYVTGISRSERQHQVTSCRSDYQIFDISGAMGDSPPPCHPVSFTFDKWGPTDVTLRIGDLVFQGHKKHLSHSCRYFEAMFGNNMMECHKKVLTVLPPTRYFEAMFGNNMMECHKKVLTVLPPTRYFEAMFGNNMMECHKKVLTVLPPTRYFEAMFGNNMMQCHKKVLTVLPPTRYFEAMFGNNMMECHKKEIRIHDVDEASFQTILSSFYTGFLSVCSQCVIRILKTGTYLQCDVVNEVCENYMLSHMELGSVFETYDIAAELGYDRITEQAIKLICANLGPAANLFETEDFLNLTPDRMSMLLDNSLTNCSETELATAVLRWAARTWEWYDILSPSEHVSSPNSSTKRVSSPNSITLSPGVSTGCLDSSSDTSLNDSGIVLTEEYFVEFPGEMPDIPSPPPSLPSSSSSYDVDDFTDSPSRSGRATRTYKRRSRSSPRNRKEPETSSKRKRKREEAPAEVETIRGLAQVRQGQREIGEVLNKIEFNNMEVETLRGFLKFDIVGRIPELYHHIRRLAGSVRYRCLPERGSKISVSLCYHRCYRSTETPTRTTSLYYLNNNRWHTLDTSFNINLISVKSLVLNNFLYLFGMQKVPGQHAVPRAFRFNQFTGIWREIAVPPHSFNSNVRCIAFKDSILMIGATTSLGSGLVTFQQRRVKILRYFPQTDSWIELEQELPITNHQLQRYVSSIICHDGLLYFVSRNALCSFDIEAEEPRMKEVAVISQMFTDISNYWLFAYQDQIILLGGLCSMQGGGNWQNREILIWNLTSESWTILQNNKPSPMYEMLTGMVYQDQIYTVSHAAAGGESIAKIELFDLVRHRWKKGTNLRYESPVHCVEYGLTVGCMLVKPLQETD